MLKLIRHIGEVITITSLEGYTVEIRVLPPSSDGSIKLAFEAPREIHILRNEMRTHAVQL